MVGSHGGNTWAACPSAAGDRALSALSATQAFELYGYRNLLRTPEDCERGRCGRDREGVRTLWRLARCLHPSQFDLAAEQNPAIPAGYTYLLQLAAHDCVHTPTPFWQIPPGRAAARNGRIARLRLDTLYGLGPFGTPHAYAPDDAKDITRSALRLGPIRSVTGELLSGTRRDIARVADPNGATGDAPIDPLICDPRNEDHAILAQMTALWHMAHNSLLGLVPGARAGGPADRAQEARFVWARAATTLVYRRILRDDLLERLLAPAVFARYRGAAEADLLDRDMAFARPRLAMPLEFSHGAMRAAHSMVRPTYLFSGGHEHQIVAALKQTSARGGKDMPLRANWVIRWSHFFDGLEAAPAANRSLRIRPRYLPALMDDQLFAGPAPGHGLAMHDLASAAAAPLWSVPALYRAIAAQARQRGWSDPFEGSTLADDAARRQALAAWLSTHGLRQDPFTPAEIGSLAEDPPLPFYIQFEAEHAHRGERLGSLGSILLAEVFVGAMLGDPLPGEQPGIRPGPSLPEALLALGAALGVQPPAERLPRDGTMPALIRFIAAEQGLETAEPAFL